MTDSKGSLDTAESQMDQIPDIIADIQQGKMVVIMDDEDRENEGDLIMAANSVRPEDINFMARYGRGLICLTLSKERCRQLNLPLMVQHASDAHGTNFTLSIEAAEGVTTGISAADRAHTIQVAVNADAKAIDIVQPGHIFPLMAQPGGVLTRAGHTEAGCDLARLAGFEPAAAIVEILNEDGSMARRDDLVVFAREHGLKIGTVADLIRYRLLSDHTVTRLHQQSLETEFGSFQTITYEDELDQSLHFALIYGEPNFDESVLVRVHVQDTLNDVLHMRHERMGKPLRVAMEAVAKRGSGIVVLLRYAESPRELLEVLQQLNVPPVRDINKAPESKVLRTHGTGAQILHDLGVKKMHILGTPRKIYGLSGFGLEVTGFVDDDSIA